MAYYFSPPPSIEEMIADFCRWMAHHARAKITVNIEHSNGDTYNYTVDLRSLKKEALK